MRLLWAHTWDRRDLADTQSLSWHLGIEFIRFYDLDEDGYRLHEIPAGWQLNVGIGTVTWSLMTEAATRHIYGDDVRWLPKVGEG